MTLALRTCRILGTSKCQEHRHRQRLQLQLQLPQNHGKTASYDTQQP